MRRHLTVNTRVRRVLAEAGMLQSDLARILGLSETQVSLMLKYELARPEQDKIIQAIKDAQENKNGKAKDTTGTSASVH